MKRKYSYIGLSLIILVFGIWSIPKIVAYVKSNYSKPDSAYLKKELATIGKVPEFSFINQNGETITNAYYQGKVYVVEFFFTSCPTICPIMNNNMVLLQNEFFGNPNFGIAAFSIDPTKDTPEVLKKYAESYGITHPNWNLLTGDREKIYSLANTGFNLYVAEAPEVPGNFEHSGYFALVDQEGNIRSRRDDFGNPIIYYNGLEKKDLQMLKEDIKKLL